MITRPDEYKHQNNSYAIVDNANVRGGIFDLTIIDNTNLLTIPADKRKVRSTIHNGTDNKLYNYTGNDVLDVTWGNTANWILASGSNYTGGTGVTVTGTTINVGTENGTYDSGWTWLLGNASNMGSYIYDYNQFYALVKKPAFETGFKTSFVSIIPEISECISTTHLDNTAANIRSAGTYAKSVSDTLTSSGIKASRTESGVVVNTNFELATTSAGAHSAVMGSGYTSFAGIQYEADYSANYTDRSLVDKAFVLANGGSGYTHPTGFTNQPVSALTESNVISQITVNNEGHVTGITSRSLSGLVPSGGALGYVLKKNSVTDYDYSWQIDSTTSDTLTSNITYNATASTTWSEVCTYIKSIPNDLGGNTVNIKLYAGNTYTTITNYDLTDFVNKRGINYFYNGNVVIDTTVAGSKAYIVGTLGIGTRFNSPVEMRDIGFSYPSGTTTVQAFAYIGGSAGTSTSFKNCSFDMSNLTPAGTTANVFAVSASSDVVTFVSFFACTFKNTTATINSSSAVRINTGYTLTPTSVYFIENTYTTTALTHGVYEAGSNVVLIYEKVGSPNFYSTSLKGAAATHAGAITLT